MNKEYSIEEELEESLKIKKDLQQKIDKAIMELANPFEDEDGDASWYEIADTYKEQINKAISILKEGSDK